jgi:hypothetical protein
MKQGKRCLNLVTFKGPERDYASAAYRWFVAAGVEN